MDFDCSMEPDGDETSLCVTRDELPDGSPATGCAATLTFAADGSFSLQLGLTYKTPEVRKSATREQIESAALEWAKALVHLAATGLLSHIERTKNEVTGPIVH